MADDQAPELSTEEVASASSALDQDSWFNATEALRISLELPPLLLDHGGRNESSDNVRLAVSWAFYYSIEVSRETGSPRVSVMPHMQLPGDVSVPPNVKDVKQELVNVWDNLLSFALPHFLRARLNHLMFERGGKCRFEHGMAAIESYVNSAETWERGFDSADDMERALRLARALRQDTWVTTVCARLAEFTRNVIAQDSWAPGLALHYLRPALEEPTSDRNDLNNLLLELQDRYKSDNHIVDEVLRIRASRTSDSAERLNLYRERVSLWLTAAETGDGVLKSTNRKTALQIAEESADPALRERAAAELQKTRREDLQLMRMTSSTHVEREQVERIFAPIRDAKTWQEALTEFSFFGPISGDSDKNREHVRESARLAPLQAILPVEKLGGDGLPRFKAVTDEERALVQLADWESHQISSMSPWLADALKVVAERHGLPSEDELTDFIGRQSWVTPEDSANVARCLIRFWTGDFDGCSYIVATKIEAIARRLVVALGVGIYRLQREQTPGQYPGLGVLLEALKEKGLPEGWYRFIRTVCTGPEGMNLRNEIAHGFVPALSSVGAVLLLQSAMFLTQIPVGESPTPAKEEI